MPRRWSRSSDRGRRGISGAQSIRAGSADRLTSRKARALVGLSRLEEARDALVDGLQFEPNDKVSRLAMGNSASASADPAGVERFPQGDRRKDCRGRRLDQLYMTARIVTMHSVWHLQPGILFSLVMATALLGGTSAFDGTEMTAHQKGDSMRRHKEVDLTRPGTEF